MTKPNKKIKRIAMLRRRLADNPVEWTNAVNASVKKVKLATSPKIIPKGRNLPFAVPADNSTGKMGKIHGDKTVKIPAKKEKTSRRIILELPFYFLILITTQ
jgi:hypothetical protein